MAEIYLIPTPLGNLLQGQIPNLNLEVIKSLDYFVVENLRTARRYIASLKLDIDIDSLTMAELSEHTPPEDIAALLEPILKDNRNCGIMSEAGLPCVADPGSALVELAHKHNIKIIPLVGPSSIMLALMASGMNGQYFAFNGYLPLKEPERAKKLKLTVDNLRGGQTQIFIETPYRNNNMLETLVKTIPAQMRICVACNLMSHEEKITCQSVEKWKSHKITLPKEPTIFIIGQ